MKFTCIAKELEQAVKRIRTFVPKKSTFEDLTKMFIQVEDKTVTITAGSDIYDNSRICAVEKLATQADGRVCDTHMFEVFAGDWMQHTKQK